MRTLGTAGGLSSHSYTEQSPSSRPHGGGQPVSSHPFFGALSLLICPLLPLKPPHERCEVLRTHLCDPECGVLIGSPLLQAGSAPMWATYPDRRRQQGLQGMGWPSPDSSSQPWSGASKGGRRTWGTERS